MFLLSPPRDAQGVNELDDGNGGDTKGARLCPVSEGDMDLSLSLAKELRDGSGGEDGGLLTSVPLFILLRRSGGVFIQLNFAVELAGLDWPC